MLKSKTARALLGGQWEVDVKYGLQYLSNYLDGNTTKKEDNSFTVIHSDGSINTSTSLNDEVSKGAIAHFVISGAMMLEDGACSHGIRSTSQMIAAADANPSISGILIEVNSGGGESAAGTVLMNTLLDVRSRDQTKVAVYAQAICSAAYRGLMGANYIVASSNTVDVGSVGTYVSINQNVINEVKDKSITVYARQSTLKNRDIRDLMNGDREALEDWVTVKAQGFIDDVERVRDGMKRTTEQYNRLRAGDIFTAKEAASFGMIDAVGTMATVISFLQGRPEENTRYGEKSNNNNIMSNRLTRAINELLGTNKVAEDATPEVMAKALEDHNANEILEEAPNTLDPSEELEGVELTEELEAIQEAVNEAVEVNTIEAQSLMVAELSDQLAVLSSALEDLKESNSQLEKTVADLKVGKPSAKVNSKAPDRSQFNTASIVGDGTPTNGSKY